MSDGFVLRPETAADRDGVRAVNLDAFDTATEADLVEALRADPAWLPEYSWLAVDTGEAVAYALLTRCHIADSASLALGPVAVRSDRQRRGLGQAVTRAVLAAARGNGEPSVVVLGHPEYYPRLGFVRASDYGITLDVDVPDEAFMVLALDDGPLPRGPVRYAPPFRV